MIDSDDLYGPMEVNDDLSTAPGTETLADRDVVSLSFDYTPGSSADTLPIEIFEHRRFLRIERSVKRLITPERNALAGNTIKVCGCLKVWWDQGRQPQQLGSGEMAEYLNSGPIVHCKA
jgi:hypothetical protein